jgi:pyrroloquinoline quinone biosynthesis protein E
VLAIKQLVLEVTEACPHSCLHCYNYWREKRAPVSSPDALTQKEIRSLIRRIKGETTLQHVGISGGEPLLRPDLAEIVADLMEEGLEVVIISSGALLTPARAAQYPKQTAFEITLFSAEAALHDRIAGRTGAFQRVLEGAACLWARGCRMAASVVVNRLNAHQVRDALELGVALGASTFLLNRMNLSRATFPMAGELMPRPVQLKEMLDSAEEFAIRYRVTIAVAVPIPPCIVDLTPYHHLLFGWCPRGKAENVYYTVSHNGFLRPWNHSSVILGDLRKESLASLVNGRKAAAFWAPVPAACRRCKYPGHELCRGGCPAASDECYGTRKRWDPIVDLARLNSR